MTIFVNYDIIKIGHQRGGIKIIQGERIKEMKDNMTTKTIAVVAEKVETEKEREEMTAEEMYFLLYHRI